MNRRRTSPRMSSSTRVVRGRAACRTVLAARGRRGTRRPRAWLGLGAGLGRVTVRFETRDTPPGPIHTFAADDPALRRVDPA